MKHNLNPNSTLQRTFDTKNFSDVILGLKKPNPPTPEAIAKAKFVDKTYQWNGR